MGINFHGIQEEDLISHHFTYDPETGLFTWKYGHKQGKYAGVKHKGYIELQVRKKRFKAHRVAWYLYYGTWPYKGLHLDHINGIRSDNRIANLRQVTNRVNQMNWHKSTGKLLGAFYIKSSGKYQALIRINGKSNYIGLFNTEIEAHNAYVARKKEVYPEAFAFQDQEVVNG